MSIPRFTAHASLEPSTASLAARPSAMRGSVIPQSTPPSPCGARLDACLAAASSAFDECSCRNAYRRCTGRGPLERCPT